jgi:hypothetical protein
MNDLVEGRVNSLEEIARSENKVERHIRHLAPLALVSPRIIEAIANGSAPADLTVTTLARALPPPHRPYNPCGSIGAPPLYAINRPRQKDEAPVGAE